MTGLTGMKRKDTVYLWLFLLWVFFAAGPGMLIANTDKSRVLGLPPLYVWAVLMWLCAVVYLYFLGYVKTFCMVSEDMSKYEDNGGD